MPEAVEERLPGDPLAQALPYMIGMQGEVELCITLDDISQDGEPYEDVFLPCGIAMITRRFRELIKPSPFSEREIKNGKGRRIGWPLPDGNGVIVCELSECERMGGHTLRQRPVLRSP